MNGQYHGHQIYFHDTGKPSVKITYSNGLRNGPLVKYYKNGKTQESAYYVNDKKHGISEWYFDNQQLSLQTITLMVLLRILPTHITKTVF